MKHEQMQHQRHRRSLHLNLDWHTAGMDVGEIHEEAIKMIEEKTNGGLR